MVADLTIDYITGEVTHLGGSKLPKSIPMAEWVAATQQYGELTSKFIEETYAAQERFKNGVVGEVLSLVQTHLGKDILERIQEAKGFNITIVNPTTKWTNEPDKEEAEPEGLVHLNDLRRVEIVCIVTEALRTKIGTKPHYLDQAARHKCAMPLKTLQRLCRKKLVFKTTTNMRVKGVQNTGTLESDNVGEYYLNSLPDILLQEGWKTYGAEDKFVPEVISHPFWRDED
jgi:hypothetical protein